MYERGRVKGDLWSYTPLLVVYDHNFLESPGETNDLAFYFDDIGHLFEKKSGEKDIMTSEKIAMES